MIKFRTRATFSTEQSKPKIAFDGESKDFRAFFDAQQRLRYELSEVLRNHNGQGKRLNPKSGTKGTITFTINWECTLNGRAPARPKDVIAAEKAQRAARQQAEEERAQQCEKERQRREMERQQQVIQRRMRIQHQVDFAFSQGSTGTEPVGKYITCQVCDAPATFLTLSAEVPRGAVTLVEDLVTGALCAQHSNHWSDKLPKIPCNQLEFFYDGVRQIAIKVKP